MYAPTALYFYKVIFTIELLIAESLMCMHMKRRRFFALRLAATFVVCAGVAFAVPIVSYSAFYCSFMFILLFGVSILGLFFCYNEKIMPVLFRAIAAYTTQHVAFQIFELTSFGINAVFLGSAAGTGAYGSGDVTTILPDAIFNFGSLSSGSIFTLLARLFTVVAYIFVYVITYYASCVFITRKLKDGDKFELKNSAMFVFVICFLLFNIVVSSFVTYYSGKAFDAFYLVLLDLYNIGGAFFTLYLMIEVIFRKQLEHDYYMSNRLLKQAGEQYELAKRNVELINMKCHDLKHQIHSAIGKTVDAEALKEIDGIISIYDANIRTGNDALDIILTEKSLYCTKHDIKLYCIIDGKLLNFISNADLYSLFGNILDNAIEAVRHLERKRRFINLSVRETNGFTCITESNSREHELEFVNGLPKSTKTDSDIHGYGLKSIRHVCKKYNAELALSTPAGKFELTIVFMH